MAIRTSVGELGLEGREASVGLVKGGGMGRRAIRLRPGRHKRGGANVDPNEAAVYRRRGHGIPPSVRHASAWDPGQGMVVPRESAVGAA